MIVSDKRGFVSHTKSNRVMHKIIGGSIKAIVHHRHQRAYDPNVEVLKDSLHNLTLKGNSRMKKNPVEGAGLLKKKSKYIIF